jgi:phosphatidate cytidylyltransferase
MTHWRNLPDENAGSVPAPSEQPEGAEVTAAAETQGGAAAGRWGDLRVRIVSAAVLAPLALGCIWIGGAAFALLLALIAAGLAYEWLGLCGRPGLGAAVPFAALPASVLVAATGHAAAALMLLGVATLVASVLARGVSPSRPLAFGIPYLGVAAVGLVWLRLPAGSGGANVIVLLLIVWASDIGAYAAGRAIGGPRLAPSISPGKTWSGAAGGLFAAAVTGLAASAVLGSGPVSWRPAGFAVLVGLVGQLGDLFESRLKRHFGVKDSGHLIPGHGGLLDRLDGMLTAAPLAALLALMVGPGVVLWE